MLEHVNIAMNTLAQTVKNLSAIFRFDPWVGKIPWRRERQPTPVFLTGEFHGQRSLSGYSPWRCKQSDMTEQLTRTHTHTHTFLNNHTIWISRQPFLNHLKEYNYKLKVVLEYEASTALIYLC